MEKPTPISVIAKIHADGTIEEVNQKWSYRQMRLFIGGRCEWLPSTIKRRLLVVHDDGIRKDLPINEEATKLVDKAILIAGFVRGNALLIKG